MRTRKQKRVRVVVIPLHILKQKQKTWMTRTGEKCIFALVKSISCSILAAVWWMWYLSDLVTNPLSFCWHLHDVIHCLIPECIFILQPRTVAAYNSGLRRDNTTALVLVHYTLPTTRRTEVVTIGHETRTCWNFVSSLWGCFLSVWACALLKIIWNHGAIDVIWCWCYFVWTDVERWESAN